MNRNNDKPQVFWIYEPKTLFEKNNYCKIIPVHDMTMIEKLNTLTRLLFYLTIIFVLFFKPKYANVTILLIIVLIIFYFFTRKEYFHNSNEKKMEKVKEEKKKDQKKSRDRQKKSIKKDSLENGDYVKRQLMDTTIINDQSKFANFLFQLPESCKENQLHCLRHEDIRFHKSDSETE